MKRFTAIVILFFCLSLGAVDLINEDFSDGLPAGWTQTGFTANHWTTNITNYAGGTADELMLIWNPAETGTFRFIFPSFNTDRVHDMSLSFRHMLDWYSANFTLGVQISTDLVNWNTVWSVTPTADIPAQTVNAAIPWNWGASQNTYLAFVFIGNTYNLNFWYIDDIHLSYTDTLGSGLWSTLYNNPFGDLIIPSGQTLTLGPGIYIFMSTDTSIIVEGSLKAEGTQQQKITLGTSGDPIFWNGIDIYNVDAVNDSTILDWCVIQDSNDSGLEVGNSPKVRVSNCEIRSNSASGSGGGIKCLSSDILVKGCFIHANSSTADGSGVYWSGGTPRFHHNRIIQNTVSSLYQHGAIAFSICDLSYITDNLVLNNSFAGNTGAVYLYNCSGNLRRHLIANNSSYGMYINNSVSSDWLEIDHCDIVNNGNYGIYFTSRVRVENSICWGNNGAYLLEIHNASPSTLWIEVYFSCIRRGIYGIDYIDQMNYQNNISSNPLFVNPTEAAGTDYDAYTAIWRLQDFSLCIDAGNYNSGEWDADFSNPDIGMYPRRLKPTCYSAADVAPDQGHQIDLRWYPNDKDISWDPSAWYHVFRSVDRSSEELTDVVLVTDPRQISPSLIASGSKICWINHDRIFTYLGQMKAMNRSAYSLIVPSLQDSSASGTHPEVFVVTYFDNVYFWDSVGIEGYSVDNIPPLPPSGTRINRLATNDFRLEWDEVTEGCWEGNSYPETNPISYLIYASDQPDFVPSSENFVAQTTNLSAVITGMTASRRFFRIVASDSR